MKYFRANGLNAVDLKKKNHLVNYYPKGVGPVDVKNGKSGKWEVTTFTLTEFDVGLNNLRLIRDGQWQRIVPPGTYTKLTYNGNIVMSDTPAESHEQLGFYWQARGKILISGLGLGFGIKAILNKKEVEQVTVLEKSQDVIKLVGPSIKDKRVVIVHCDVINYKPNKNLKWDVVWHDIWSDICEDNKSEMKKLKAKFARRCSWQGCWSQEYL